MQRATHFRFSISRLILPSYFSLFLSFYNCLSLIFLIFSIMIQCNDIVTIEIPSKIQWKPLIFSILESFSKRPSRSHGSRERKREIPFREIPFEKECFSFPPREFYFTIMSGTLVSIRLTRPG